MPRPLPVPVRQAIFRLWNQGRQAPQIAASLGVPGSTVYRLIQRFRRDGSAGIPPSYHNPSAGAAPSDVVKEALDLRREHPTWGSEWIRIQLLDEAPQRPIPTDRTLRRWFVRTDLAPAPAGRRPKARADRAASPHDTWQMDAKEHIKLNNRHEVSWLRMIDECSGAVLQTTVFPPRDLVQGPSRRRAPRASPSLRPLGTPRPPPGRQRHPLGVLGRLPHRPRAVGDRAGDRGPLE